MIIIAKTYWNETFSTCIKDIKIETAVSARVLNKSERTERPNFYKQESHIYAHENNCKDVHIMTGKAYPQGKKEKNNKYKM